MVLFQLSNIASDLSLVSHTDAILLRQDAVYLALTPHILPACQHYLLRQDAADRQVDCPTSMTLIDDSQWVALTLEANTVISC
jgi:sulfur relay protein TusB/DsrH